MEQSSGPNLGFCSWARLFLQNPAGPASTGAGKEPMEQSGIQTPKWDLSGITERAGGRGRARCGVIPLPLLAPPGDNDGINELISFIPRENLAHREKEWR